MTQPIRNIVGTSYPHWQWLFVLGITLFFTIADTPYGAPGAFNNEAVYLLRGRQLVDHTFLAQDWLFGIDSLGRDAAKIPFDWMVAAVWMFTDDGALVALIGRLACWLLLGYGYLRLAAVMGISPLLALLIWAVWFKEGPSIGAAEWVWGGVESKCFAYALIFIALRWIYQQRMIAAALAMGLACWFHVLVGGWASAFICFGLLAMYGIRRIGSVLRFALPCAAIGVGSILYTYASTGMATAGVEDPRFNLAQLLVVFRNPHHLYPPEFVDADTWLALALSVGALLLCIRSRHAADFERFAFGFVAAAAAVYVGGIWCASAGVLTPLVYYPFRVGDVLITLLSSLVVVRMISHSQRVTAALESRDWPQRAYWSFGALLVAVLLGRYYEPFSDHVSLWRQYLATPALQRPQLVYPEYQLWLRDHSNSDAVVLVSPCAAGDVFLGAERATMVAFKSAPVSASMAYQWMQRISALNGEWLEQRPPELCEQLEQRVDALTAAQLSDLHTQYAVDWYVSETERADLPISGIEVGHAWLYRLEEP